MKKIFLIIFTGFLVAFVLFVVSLFTIYSGVKKTCLQARKEYQEDCLSSLIKVVESDNHSFREKNSAIWALGQIADSKALPFLFELEKTLPEQERCSYDRFICRHEVEKAIKWCTQGNITNWMYSQREQWNYAKIELRRDD